MIGLLDVNTLVALFDPEHVHHRMAHDWFGAHRELGWASCPLTENGLVRVVSNPKYPGRRATVAAAIERFQRFRVSGDHVFWPDSVSISDANRFASHHVLGHRQLTDVYLLALAVEHDGRLITFDRTIQRKSVTGAAGAHLEVIGGAS
jgi:toxin-antitoxin system PIN domain toxin